jgi:hypothetical protein
VDEETEEEYEDEELEESVLLLIIFGIIKLIYCGINDK